MTGFSCLDNILGGYRPGTINVIAGRGMAGKTSIALNIAQNVARTSGKAVAYYSGKESKAKITERLIKLLCVKACERMNYITKEEAAQLLLHRIDFERFGEQEEAE